MDEKIEFEIKYTVNDYTRSLSFMQNRLPLNKYGFIIFPAIAVFAIVLYLFFASGSKSQPILPSIVIALKAKF